MSTIFLSNPAISVCIEAWRGSYVALLDAAVGSAMRAYSWEELSGYQGTVNANGNDRVVPAINFLEYGDLVLSTGQWSLRNVSHIHTA